MTLIFSILHFCWKSLMELFPTNRCFFASQGFGQGKHLYLGNRLPLVLQLHFNRRYWLKLVWWRYNASRPILNGQNCSLRVTACFHYNRESGSLCLAIFPQMKCIFISGLVFLWVIHDTTFFTLDEFIEDSECWDSLPKLKIQPL